MSSSLYFNDALNLVPSTDELVARVVDVIKVRALTPVHYGIQRTKEFLPQVGTAPKIPATKQQ